LAKKILIVEDHPHMLFAIQTSLEHSGYETITSTSGQSALQQLPKNPPDLVILDIAMPRMDGWQVFEEIRKISRVPVILLTGLHISTEDYFRGLEMGASAYLTKPILMETLIDHVEVALAQ
jgi:two-component system response regulator VanR